jgi:hypothetical protein
LYCGCNPASGSGAVCNLSRTFGRYERLRGIRYMVTAQPQANGIS